MIDQNLLNDYIYDPDNDIINYQLALQYDTYEQNAAAFSFYLRTADRTSNLDLRYECLIRMGMIFHRLGNRRMSAKYMYQKAISLIPHYSSAYIYLSRLHEQNQDYQDSYTAVELALQPHIEYKSLSNLYYQKSVCLFQKAVACYWCESTMKARKLLRDLLQEEYWNELDDSHKAAVEDNLMRIGIGPESQAFRPYKKEKYNNIRFKFKDSEKIEQNYSQVLQDMFILSMTNGKRNGTFLEVGGGDPYKGNNTVLLEQNYNWRGISIENNEDLFNKYSKERPSVTLYKSDALKINYKELLNNFDSNIIDYLQLDIEPSRNTYECLLKIPFDDYKFRVITYEHDDYIDITKSCKKKSRQYLQSKGYQLIVSDVSPDGQSTFEDWWVHPDLVDSNIISLMEDLSNKVTNIEDYFYPFDFDNNFDWGVLENTDLELYKFYQKFIKSEIIDGNYTKFFDVNYNDVVFDVGSSVGPFAFSILNKGPKEVHCFEPNKSLFNTSLNNFKKFKNVYVNNLAIASSNDENVVLDGVFNSDKTDNIEKDVWLSEEKVNTTTFMSYIKKHNIQKIDFLKTDCEGGEYDIFNKENVDWITRNVRYVSGEFHTNWERPHLKELFKVFRDNYLTKAKSYKAFTYGIGGYYNYRNEEIWDDSFIDNNLNYCNIVFEFDIDHSNDNDKSFTISKENKNTVWIVDNFFEKPDEVREFALQQNYIEGGLGRGFIGRRSEKQFLFDGLKEKFEEIIQRKIIKWEEYGMNGRFQIAWAGEPLVYHCDNQKWGGMLFLTPNAPYSCGTTLYADRKNGARSYYDEGWDEFWSNTPGDAHLDGTAFEPVDVIGNVYNRLMIFDASCIHSASQYFGTIKDNSRLWQMFFFDSE